MSIGRGIRQVAEGALVGAGLAVAAYGAYIGAAWIRYGQVKRSCDAAESDILLDHFMPNYEVVERNAVEVAAPAAVTFATACQQRLEDSPVVRTLFSVRELVMGSRPSESDRPREMIAMMRALGWGVLALVPEREIVMGAITRPWAPRPVFEALTPEQFPHYTEPGYVKIIWTLRADPRGAASSIFRTETRAMTTDPEARAHFRWYWAKASPGIWLIRQVTMGPVKREAERRVRLA
jgi:hypothetical protein